MKSNIVWKVNRDLYGWHTSVQIRIPGTLIFENAIHLNNVLASGNSYEIGQVSYLVSVFDNTMENRRGDDNDE
jgi:hypothetical protein